MMSLSGAREEAGPTPPGPGSTPAPWLRLATGWTTGQRGPSGMGAGSCDRLWEETRRGVGKEVRHLGHPPPLGSRFRPTARRTPRQTPPEDSGSPPRAGSHGGPESPRSGHGIRHGAAWRRSGSGLPAAGLPHRRCRCRELQRKPGGNPTDDLSAMKRLHPPRSVGMEHPVVAVQQEDPQSPQGHSSWEPEPTPPMGPVCQRAPAPVWLPRASCPVAPRWILPIAEGVLPLGLPAARNPAAQK